MADIQMCFITGFSKGKEKGKGGYTLYISRARKREGFFKSAQSILSFLSLFHLSHPSPSPPIPLFIGISGETSWTAYRNLEVLKCRNLEDDLRGGEHLSN